MLFLPFLIILSCEQEEGLLDPLETDQWITYSTDQGMAGVQVRDIMQDSRGDLWFANFRDGVTRFNGQNWEVFNESNSPLGEAGVLAIEEDVDGDMWFGTTAGIYFLVDGEEWLYYAGEDPDTPMIVNCFYSATNNWMWVGTEGQGFYLWDTENFTHIEFSQSEYLNVINDIDEMSPGEICMASELGLLIWDGEIWQLSTMESGLPEYDLTSLYKDRSDRLWIGTKGGETVTWYDGSSFNNIDPFNGQPNVFIFGISQDRNGDIWFATFLDGVLRYDGAVMHSYKKFNGFPDEDNFTVMTDHDGNIWIGTVSTGAVKYIPPVKY